MKEKNTVIEYEAVEDRVYEELASYQLPENANELDHDVDYIWNGIWRTIKLKYPSSKYNVYENLDGWNYHHDGISGWVKTSITIRCQTLVDYTPIVDEDNQAIRVTNIKSTDVDRAIKRSLVRACQQHGLWQDLVV